MPIELPAQGQAALPMYRDTSTLIRDNIIAQKSSVLPPRIIIADSTLATPALDAKSGISRRSLQNCGTSAIYWAKGMVPDAEHFHGILAGCIAQDDGTGSVKDFSDVEGAIFILAKTGAPRVATYEALAPEAGIMNKTVAP